MIKLLTNDFLNNYSAVKKENTNFANMTINNLSTKIDILESGYVAKVPSPHPNSKPNSNPKFSGARQKQNTSISAS